MFQISKQDLILKGLATMLDAKFKKDPTDKLHFSMSEVIDYMKKNYPQYDIKTKYSANDLEVELRPANVKTN